MEFISERVSVERGPESLSIVISARLPRPKEALLVAWFTAWTACGAYFIWSLSQHPDEKTRTGLIIMLAFWLWFEWRIGRVLLWRLKGFEIWRLKGNILTVKDSILGYGKASDYFLDNIERFGTLQVDPTSWKWQLNDSFWVMGGERLGFEYTGRKVVLGKGLSAMEAQRAAQALDNALKRARKQHAAEKRS